MTVAWVQDPLALSLTTFTHLPWMSQTYFVPLTTLILSFRTSRPLFLPPPFGVLGEPERERFELGGERS